MNPLLNNPFLKNPAPGPQINPQMKEFMAMMQGRNPMDVFVQYAQNNPQMQPILNALKNGNNPEQLVRSICKERGIDVNEFMKQFR